MISKKPWDKPPWFSSYENNNFGEIFYSLIRIYKPRKVVELGTKAGYSAYHIARGLKDNELGTLDCFDLWEDFPFNPTPKSQAEENLKEFKNLVKLKKLDILKAHKNFKSIDILHIDIHNEGQILNRIVPLWIDKVKQFIIIEGGSSERDSVSWMKKYHKQPIRQWLENFMAKNDNLQCYTFEPFPSLTIIRKKI